MKLEDLERLVRDNRNLEREVSTLKSCIEILEAKIEDLKVPKLPKPPKLTKEQADDWCSQINELSHKYDKERL